MKKYTPKHSRLLKPDKKYSRPSTESSFRLKKNVLGPVIVFVQSIFRKIPLQRLKSGFAERFIQRLRRKLGSPIAAKSYRGKSFTFPDMDRFRGMRAGSLLDGARRYRVVIAGAIAGVTIAFLAILIYDFHRVQSLAQFRPNITTKIYDKNDILISELFRQKREVVPLKKIPQDLRNAFIAIEDREFYEHNGINIKGIVRAFFVNLYSGRIRQGGSTITQQLSKILLTSGERNIYRKIKEAFIAIMMEFSFSKDEILNLYLNQIFLGHGTYGVESASQIYFGKHVWDLNLAEASLLATLPSAPNLLSPIRYPKRSMLRHKIVMAKMVEAGFVTVEEVEKAYLDFWPDYLDYISNVSPTKNAWSNKIDEAPWFTEYIRRRLVREFGDEMVYEKGLQVYTTLDIHKQRAAQKVLADALERQTAVSSSLIFNNEEYFAENFSDVLNLVGGIFAMPEFTRRGSREAQNFNDAFKANIIDELDGLSYLAGFEDVNRFLETYRRGFLMEKDQQQVEGCIISIDHRTGYIEALVGGSEFSSINQLNRAMQAKRQPGSAIKPLLYSAAFETGEFTPATAILDSPIVYLDQEGGDWLPENYEGEYYGMVRLRKALSKSINVVSIRIADKLGIDRVLRTYGRYLDLNDSETRSRVPRNFSIALGSFEVTPYELTRAYAMIANGGRYVLPFSIRYVKDREGAVILNDEEKAREEVRRREEKGSIQVIKPETAQVMISMLRDVVAHGTGGAASPQRIAAGKTGTTNNWKDAWFVGFVPQLTTGVWVGYDKLGLSLGIGQSGGAVAAPLWGAYMREAMANEAYMEFPHYAGLVEAEVCERTGLLPSSSCRSRVREVFIAGSVPEQECELCSEIGDAPLIKGPGDNISEKQKQAIFKNMKSDTENTIIDNIGNDLLNMGR